MPYLNSQQFDVRFIEDNRSLRWPFDPIVRRFERWCAERFRISYNFHVFWTHRQQIREADILITTMDSSGLVVLHDKARGHTRARVIYISQGLYVFAWAASKNRFNEWVRRRVASWLRSADEIVVFGEGDLKAMCESFADRVPLYPKVIQFGVDERFWTPSEAAGEPFILSVGSDPLRDYDVLFEAVKDRPLTIVTQQRFSANHLGPNVRVLCELSWDQLRALYRQALFVVCPVKNEPRDSGHSATLQAMACGKTVILSQTPGLWDPDRMRHGETCWLVPPGDPQALRVAMSYLTDHPDEVRRIGINARRLVEEKYSSRQFGLSLQDCLRQADTPANR